VNLNDVQFAFSSNANTICLAKAEQLRKEGYTLTTIDITNAFNSIPHKAIMLGLEEHNVSPIYREYVQTFLKMRFCDLGRDINCGVP